MVPTFYIGSKIRGWVSFCIFLTLFWGGGVDPAGHARGHHRHHRQHGRQVPVLLQLGPRGHQAVRHHGSQAGTWQKRDRVMRSFSAPNFSAVWAMYCLFKILFYSTANGQIFPIATNSSQFLKIQSFTMCKVLITFALWSEFIFNYSEEIAIQNHAIGSQLNSANHGFIFFLYKLCFYSFITV